MQHIVNDVQTFSVNNHMQLDPSKCKEMVVDLLNYNSYELQPIVIGGSYIQRVESFKLLGVYISSDLTWLVHCNYMIKKANRRLYALRQLVRARVIASDIVTIYCSLVRSVLEYASVVFANLPAYLEDAIEFVQSER